MGCLLAASVRFAWRTLICDTNNLPRFYPHRQFSDPTRKASPSARIGHSIFTAFKALATIKPALFTSYLALTATKVQDRIRCACQRIGLQPPLDLGVQAEGVVPCRRAVSAASALTPLAASAPRTGASSLATGSAMMPSPVAARLRCIASGYTSWPSSSTAACSSPTAQCATLTLKVTGSACFIRVRPTITVLACFSINVTAALRQRIQRRQARLEEQHQGTIHHNLAGGSLMKVALETVRQRCPTLFDEGNGRVAAAHDPFGNRFAIEAMCFKAVSHPTALTGWHGAARLLDLGQHGPAHEGVQQAGTMVALTISFEADLFGSMPWTKRTDQSTKAQRRTCVRKSNIMLGWRQILSNPKNCMMEYP